MTDLADLIARVVGATAEQQADLLEEAFRAVFPKPPHDPDYHHWFTKWASFIKKINAGAYVDAALMLVPEGWDFTIGCDRIYAIQSWAALFPIGDRGDCDAEICSPAATPALALCAAALRALAAKEAG